MAIDAEHIAFLRARPGRSYGVLVDSDDNPVEVIDLTVSFVQTLCDSHEELRAEVARLARERDRWQSLTIMPRGAVELQRRLVKAKAARATVRTATLDEAIQAVQAIMRFKLSSIWPGELVEDADGHWLERGLVLCALEALKPRPAPDGEDTAK